MGLRIKEVIKEKGMTVQTLAERMNISRVGLSQHINGNPSVEVLERIASALDVDISELFQRKNDSNSIVCPHCGKPIYLEISAKGRMEASLNNEQNMEDSIPFD